jgi:phage terminase large subunit-like protein
MPAQELSSCRVEARGHFFEADPAKPRQDHADVRAVRQIRSRRGLLPQQAPWFSDSEVEVLAFPGAKFDDQVDSTSQALEHGSRRLTFIEALD